MLRRILREPLLHFLVLAVSIFMTYGLLNREHASEPDLIIVSPAKIEQLASLFASTWQRPPTAEELKGLVDDFVKDEIYYREAKKLGLDTDDSVIRRRLRLKMEFLNDAAANALSPSDAELEAYLNAHPEKFEIDPALAFQQVFLNPQKHGNKVDQDVAAILASLKSDPKVDPAGFGDPSLLPADMPLTPKSGIDQIFGRDFADALEKLPAGQWVGPVTSGLGSHIVRVSERQPGRVPSLVEVRNAVLREWTDEKRKEIEEQAFATLLKRYKVEIDTGKAAETAP
jgi:hypothetical protein